MTTAEPVAYLQWRKEVAQHDYAAASSYLSIRHGETRAREVSKKLQQLPVITPQTQTQGARRTGLGRDARHHAGHVLGLPQHLVQRHFVALALERRDVNLPARSTPVRREPLHHRRCGDDLSGLGLAGHAVGGVHRGAEHVTVLEHHRTEVTADADGDRLPLDLQLRVRRDLLLHLCRRVERGIGVGEGGHDLIAHGLDHRAVALLGGVAHHLDADRHHVTSAHIPHDVVQPRRADDVGKEYG